MRGLVAGGSFVVGSAIVFPADAGAQRLGTLRWQLQPYCNVVTLTVTEACGVYSLDGFDDQRGAATRAPITGTAAANPDGTISRSNSRAPASHSR
jgi:hypothetical protein